LGSESKSELTKPKIFKIIDMVRGQKIEKDIDNAKVFLQEARD
jgi:hypothetical protein